MYSKGTIRDWYETHLEKPTIAVAFLFLIALITPFIYPFPDDIMTTLKYLKLLFWTLFSLEYGIRLFLTNDRWHFIKRHPIDFLIVFIPPLSYLYLLHTISLTAYFLRKARNLFWKQNALFLITMVPFMVVISGFLMFQTEAKVKGSNIQTFGDSLWWAVVTMGTVGYGDTYPVTDLGRIIATLTIVTGLSFIGMLTVEIAVFFIGSRAQEASRDEKNFGMVMKKLDSMEKEIIGLKGSHKTKPPKLN